MIGVLLVGRFDRPIFLESDIPFLQLLADKMAVPIENAQLYQQIQQNLQNLEMEKEIRERFVFALGHDLRGPLTAAKTNAQIISKYQDKIDSPERFILKIVESIDRADHMIQDLLDANAIKSGGHLPMNIEPCNLYVLFTMTLEELSLIHGPRFVLQPPVNLSLLGYWSFEGIRRVIENLCNDAVKYGDTEAPITLTLSPNYEKQTVNFSVHNHGPKISPEDQNILFNPFKRTKSAESSGKRGWGIGLTLVKGIVEALGGTINVASAKDVGTTFTVQLPLDARQIN